VSVTAAPTAAITANGRYIVISSDCHAGGSHAMYREYLEARYHERFDAWRERYRNPFRDLSGNRRNKNWDHDLRISEQGADGYVAEVIFPNTVPPFFPTGALVAPLPGPEDYELRQAGIRAHNRWLADWCAEHPERRAGIGQIFLNDVPTAIEDVEFVAAHGLRGGILLPNPPPDAKWLAPLYDPVYDPLWQACVDHDVIVNIHAGGGSPDYGNYPVAGVLWLLETSYFSRRPVAQLIMSGVFERFADLRLAVTEQGWGWVPETLATLDRFHAQMTGGGQVGELGFSADQVPPGKPSEYFRRNVWIGSGASPADVVADDGLLVERLMWGSDYPHAEGSFPHSRERMATSFAGLPREAAARVLGGNAAALYGFDLDRLAPYAAEAGPTVEELAAAPA
jgi:predicted TIM-barrel fold metal-dependent hydrolase